MTLEERVAYLFRLEQVDWQTFCRHTHRTDVRRDADSLLYLYEPKDILVAQQQQGDLQVVRTVLEYDLRSLVYWSDLLHAELRRLGDLVEEEALRTHFAKQRVKVEPYEPGAPAISPKLFYPRRVLKHGRLVVKHHHESVSLLTAAINFLNEQPNGGVLTLADVSRLRE